MNEVEQKSEIIKEIPTPYDLLLGKMINGELVNPLRAGYALSHEGESHYVLKLSMFPHQRYYLVKNRDSPSQYTVFSRRVVDPTAREGARFQNPVGSGRLNAELKSYLEIRFPLLFGSIFMNLFPSN
ncbi:hypothetical protein WDW37_18740 [Bdellovibrionota bacterium FG-1]